MDSDGLRELWVSEQIKKIPNGHRVLVAGAGQCKYKKYCNHLDYVSQDFDGYDGSGDGKGLQIGTWDKSQINILCDIVNIPEKDASFDAIICIEVLEHLPEPIRAIKELSRLLKPNGILIITAPFASLTHYAPFHFYSGFNKYFFNKFLKDFGLIVAEATTQGNYFDYMCQEIGRLPSVAQGYCKTSFSPEEISNFKLVANSLKRMSMLDTGSSDILCYGYRFVAKKG